MPILVLALHKFVTHVRRHLPTYCHDVNHLLVTYSTLWVCFDQLTAEKKSTDRQRQRSTNAFTFCWSICSFISDCFCRSKSNLRLAASDVSYITTLHHSSESSCLISVQQRYIRPCDKWLTG